MRSRAANQVDGDRVGTRTLAEFGPDPLVVAVAACCGTRTRVDRHPGATDRSLRSVNLADVMQEDSRDLRTGRHSPRLRESLGNPDRMPTIAITETNPQRTLSGEQVTLRPCREPRRGWPPIDLTSEATDQVEKMAHSPHVDTSARTARG